jgi:hypothetical protein
MSKNLSNKQLLIILLVLAGIYGIYRFISNKKGENTFHTAIIPKIDTNKITDMLIYTKEKKGEPMHFTKNGKTWMVSRDGYTTIADEHSEKYVIDQLGQIAPERLATNDPAQWKDFQVMDTNGTRLVLLNNKDTVIDIIVGRFGFNMQRKEGISYLRMHNQKEVYGVSGFLSMNITQEVDSWRNRKTTNMNSNVWNKVTYTYPGDSSFALKKDSTGRWMFGDGSKPDSTGTLTALNTMAQQNYGVFVYKFDTNSVKPLYNLEIAGNGINSIMIKAYPADTANKYVITSSLNPGAYFSAGKTGMLDKFFLGKKAFLHHDQPKQPATQAQPAKKKKK